MNDELQKQLSEALGGVVENAALAKDFVLAELPDVVTQLLWWNGVKSFFGFVFGVVMLLAGWRLIAYTRRNWERLEDEDIEHLPIMGVAAALIIGVAMSLSNMAWLQILIAPKVYLIEYAARLI